MAKLYRGDNYCFLKTWRYADVRSLRNEETWRKGRRNREKEGKKGVKKERRKMQRGKQQLEGWKCVLLGVHWHSRGVLHTSRALTSVGRQMQQWNLRLLFH
ncbi:hypothetical protein L798_11657 [Zootermopsis nevadensis]|uniref:Uncharacterized protein n=1 Tax=Zootermopsis nevadensis TaxID=136037 RepID=A0A067R5V4_ZOONE|nr:hypothetical protein L798_11657 [Zootermopsis nevadensis]